MKDGITISDIGTQIREALNFRHATKVFDAERKISPAQFDVILESARLSPSSFGMEPWQILLIQDPDKRELFHKTTWGANGAFNGTEGQLQMASHFGLFLVHTGATMTHHSGYLTNHLKEIKQFPDDAVQFVNDAYEKFQKQDFHIEGDRQIADWSARQAYIALGNMMTTAALMEIDSCPIEGFEMDATTEILEEHFGVDPKLYRPAVMVAFGYRLDNPAFPKTRRAMDDIVTWS